MAAEADGSIIIDTEIRKENAIDDVTSLKTALKELTAAVKELTSGLANSFTNFGSNAQGAASNIDSISDSAKTAANSVESLEEQMAKINVDYGSQPNEGSNIEPQLGHAKGEYIDYGNTVQEFVDKYSAGMDKVENSTNIFKQDIDSLTKQLKDLESQGLYLGDDEYDKVYKKLTMVKTALADYKKELLNPTKGPVINLDTLQGQVDSLKIRLRRLTDQGKSFGDSLYDSTYQSLNKAQIRLKEYKKDLVTPVNIPVTLDETSFQAQRQRLKAELAELGNRGFTFGDPGYDRAYAELQRVTQAEKSYKKSLTETNHGQKQVKSSADKMKKSVDNAGKSARTASKGMSMLGMVGRSVLFSFVFRAINAVTTAIQEGMQSIARYSDESNKALSQLKSSLTTLKNSFAAAFSPIIEYITPALTLLISKLVDVNNWIAQTMAAIAGKDTFVKAVAVQEDYAASLSDTQKAAKNAAKEVKKATFAFDTLIQAQKPDTNTEYKAPTPDQMFKTQAISEETKDTVSAMGKALDNMKDKIIDISQIAKNGFLKGFGDFVPRLNEISSDLSSIGKNVKDIFTDANVLSASESFLNSYVDTVGKVAGSFASIGLTIATNVIGGIESYLSKNVDRIKQWLIRMFDVGTEINNIWGNFFVAFADTFSVFSSQTAQDITGSIIQIFADVFGGVLELTLKFTRDVLDMMLTPFIENKDKIKQSISETLEPIKTVVDSVASTVRKAVDGIVSLYDQHISPFFASIRDGLTKILDAILDAYNNYIVPVLDKLADKFQEVMKGPVGDAIDSALNFIGKLVDAVMLLWEKVLLPFFLWSINTFYPILAPVIQTLGSVFLNVFGAIANIVSAVFDVLSGLIDFIVGVFTGDWERAWNGIKEIFGGVWKALKAIVEAIVNSIIDIVVGLVNTVAAAIEKVIEFFDKGERKAKSSITNGYGGGGKTFSSYSTSPYSAYSNNIPQLATGTVVPPKTGNFLAMLGDNNKDYEVVSPLETMKQAFKEAIGEMGGINNGQNNAVLEVDGVKFGQLVYKYNNKENDRVGVRMVTNGG